MLPYNYGIHYDMALGGRASADVQKQLSDGSPNRSAIEIHLRIDEVGGDIFFQRLQSSISDAVVVQSDINSIDPGGDDFDAPLSLGYYRIRIEKDYGTGNITIEVADNDSSYFVDVSSFPTTSIANKLSYFGWNSTNKVALIRAEKDFGSGWESFINVDPNKVPHATNAGEYVERGSVNALAGSENRIYDTVDGNFFTLENAVTADTFPAIYNIVSINGESETPTVALGSDFDVVMSNEIDPDSVTMDDGNQTYVFDINTVGDTTTCSLPLASDDTLPKFGTVTISVINGSDTYTKDVTFAEPAGYTRVDLADPIELDESSYTFGTGLNPIATESYFYQPTTDFSIDENNVRRPTGDAPWQHTVWYLSGAGLYETTYTSGYGVVIGTPPSVTNDTPVQTVTVGDTIDVSATITGADSIAWSTDRDGVYGNAAAEDTTYTFNEAGVHTLTVEGTNADGTAGDPVQITAEPLSVVPTVNIVLIPPATPGQSVQIQAEAADAVSYAWTTSSQDVTFSDTTALQPTVSSDVQADYTLTLTATSATGDTAQASATFSVTAGQVQESSLTVTLTNMTSGTYLTTVFNPETAEVYSHGLKAWQGGSASFSLSGVADGTFCEVWVRSTNGTGRGIQEGVTV